MLAKTRRKRKGSQGKRKDKSPVVRQSFYRRLMFKLAGGNQKVMIVLMFIVSIVFLGLSIWLLSYGISNIPR